MFIFINGLYNLEDEASQSVLTGLLEQFIEINFVPKNKKNLISEMFNKIKGVLLSY